MTPEGPHGLGITHQSNSLRFTNTNQDSRVYPQDQQTRYAPYNAPRSKRLSISSSDFSSDPNSVASNDSNIIMTAPSDPLNRPQLYQLVSAAESMNGPILASYSRTAEVSAPQLSPPSERNSYAMTRNNFNPNTRTYDVFSNSPKESTNNTSNSPKKVMQLISSSNYVNSLSNSSNTFSSSQNTNYQNLDSKDSNRCHPLSYTSSMAGSFLISDPIGGQYSNPANSLNPLNLASSSSQSQNLANNYPTYPPPPSTDPNNLTPLALSSRSDSQSELRQSNWG